MVQTLVTTMLWMLALTLPAGDQLMATRPPDWEIVLTRPFSAAQQAVTASANVEADHRRVTQELMDAIAPGRVDVWRRYLHEKMLHLDENGVVRDKEAFLKELTPLPEGLIGRIEIDKFRVSIEGDLAVAAVEIQESLDYHGQHLRTRFRFLDTWVRTPNGWRLIAEHTAAVLKDPPAVRLTREELCGYAGGYQLTPKITTTVRCTDAAIISDRADRPAVTYLPEVRDVFFAAGQPRSRRVFLRDANGRVIGFADRREGKTCAGRERAMCHDETRHSMAGVRPDLGQG